MAGTGYTSHQMNDVQQSLAERFTHFERLANIY